jgi:hypothetical protein
MGKSKVASLCWGGFKISSYVDINRSHGKITYAELKVMHYMSSNNVSRPMSSHEKEASWNGEEICGMLMWLELRS